jgi:hypothetical protein
MSLSFVLDNMKFSLSIIFVILFTSCQPGISKENEIDYTDFADKSIVLAGYTRDEFKQNDTLAKIILKIPSLLDTFYQWTDFSDCLPCGNVKYRFANKKYKQFKEGGFYWTYKPDSVYQLSIWHNPIKEAPDTVFLKPLEIRDSFRSKWFERHLYCRNYKYLFKKFEKINDRTFYISAFTTPCGFLTDSASVYVTASTNIKSRQLYVVAECGAKDTTGFIDKMYKSILSIRIEEKDEMNN